ncbi:MAG: ligase-associated DNA damage response endonuclease PdeM [Ferruginibacter sp.]
MQTIIQHTILNNNFLLSAERCIYWQEQRILILSDLHLGKTGHFRKSGIAVPQGVFKEDMQRLVTQIQLFKPAGLIVIGDMFHSHGNKEHDFFVKWRNDFPMLSIQLVKGNHDILHKDWYYEAGIELSNCELTIGRFAFVHDFTDCKVPDEGYIFSGHIHPGISMHGLAKQSLQFPCFYFGEQYAVLPAFSRFTGMYSIKPKAGETVYALVNSNPLQGELGGIMKV